MVREWIQKCKDCEDREFRYSDYSLQQDSRRGYDRPERCPEHQQSHSREIQSISASHFHLIPRNTPPPILGSPFLGELERPQRKLEYEEVQPEHLPMDLGITDDSISELYSALEANQVIVVVAPTGSGKSTFIPYRLLSPIGKPLDHFTQNGPIIITQPRIQVTRAISKTVGENFLGCHIGPGCDIGYRHRGENQYDRRNRLIYVTDGSLLNWIAAGKLDSYSMIIIDEVHERSCNIDMILSLLKRELPKHPKLKLIVASATIDTNYFVDFFKDTCDTTLVEFEGKRNFGYTVEFWNKEPIPYGELPKKMAEKIIEILQTTESGGILGFMPGQGEISAVISELKEKLTITQNPDSETITGSINTVNGESYFQISALYAAAGKQKNDWALKPELDPIRPGDSASIPRRIVIATNIAETSLTVPDIEYIVDSGWIKQAEWDRNLRRMTLKARLHTRDGCKQRWGRSGRTRPGYVYTLYTEEESDGFEEHTSPEILRSCMEEHILTLKACGVSSIEDHTWFTKPSTDEIDASFGVLKERNIIDDDGDLTFKGRELWELHRSLDEGTLLLLSDRFGCSVEAATLLAFGTRLGGNLYHDNYPNERLFIWDSRWDAKRKYAVWKIHNALRVGCTDDLDFAFKLAYCYSLAENAGFGDEWLSFHHINGDSFKAAIEERNQLLESLLGKKEEKWRTRELKCKQLHVLRLVLGFAWPDRIVTLDKKDDIFDFSSKDGTNRILGQSSSFNAGTWEDGSIAVCGSLTTNGSDVDGKPGSVQYPSFLVKIPMGKRYTSECELLLAISKVVDKSGANCNNLFVDQMFPIHSHVSIETIENNVVQISNIIEHRNKSSGTRACDLRYTGDDQGAYVQNMSKLILQSFKCPDPLIGCKRVEFGSDTVIIEEWNCDGNAISACLSPYPDVLQQVLKTSERISVSVESIIGTDVHGQPGWAVMKHDAGGLFPIELSELSLSPSGYGLELIEDTEIILDQVYDQQHGYKLSFIPTVISELERLCKEVAMREKDAPDNFESDYTIEAVIVKRLPPDKVVAVVKTDNNAILHFTVRREFIFIQNVNALDVGEKVTLKLRLNDKNCQHERQYSNLSLEEIASLPSDWTYNQSNGILITPFCLKPNSELEERINPNSLEKIVRRSWTSCLRARIVSSERYYQAIAALRDREIDVHITKLMTYRGTTDISGVVFEYRMTFSDEPYSISGFLRKRDMNCPNAGDFACTLKLGDRITVKINNIDFNSSNPLIGSRIVTDP